MGIIEKIDRDEQKLKSDHFGIEIGITPTADGWDTPLKSDHFGIEIWHSMR